MTFPDAAGGVIDLIPLSGSDDTVVVSGSGEERETCACLVWVKDASAFAAGWYYSICRLRLKDGKSHTTTQLQGSSTLR